MVNSITNERVVNFGRKCQLFLTLFGGLGYFPITHTAAMGFAVKPPHEG